MSDVPPRPGLAVPAGTPPLSEAGSATIQGFWTGPPLTDLLHACLRSFVRLGHRVVLYSYEQPVVPEGVRLHDAAEIVPRAELFLFDNPNSGRRDPGPFSDYFRYRLLYKKGGWYCDVDTLCLTPCLPVAPRIWSRECPEIHADSVAGGQLFFEKGDPVVAALLDRCRALLPAIPRRESLGPLLISKVLTEFDLPLEMGGATDSTFYPIRWIESFKLWLPEFRDEVEERTRGAVFLPVYQSLPLYIGLDRGRRPPAGSFLAAFVDSLVPAASAPAHDANEVRDLTRQWLTKNGHWAFLQLRSVRAWHAPAASAGTRWLEELEAA